MKIYLSGPMRGYPDNNRAEFMRVAALLRGKWHHVFNPVEMAEGLGHTMEQTSVFTPEIATILLVSDVNAIVHCDAVALLKGWERSVGATMEVAVAQFLGREVIDAYSQEPMNLPTKPWSNY